MAPQTEPERRYPASLLPVTSERRYPASVLPVTQEQPSPRIAASGRRYPAEIPEERELSKLERAIQIVDYPAGVMRGGVRSLFGGDIYDRASFGREFSDPKSALGFLAPGGGLIPELSEDSSRLASYASKAPGFFAGLVADIGTDPFTVTTLGIGGAGKGVVGRGLRFMGKEIPGTPAAGRAIQRGLAPIGERLTPLRRKFAESKYGAPIREMFTTGPMAGATEKTREFFDAARLVRFGTDTKKREAAKRGIELRNLHRGIVRGHRTVDEADINSILTDAIERKTTIVDEADIKGPLTFPEAFKDTMPTAQYQKLETARDTILADARSQKLITRVKDIQKDIIDRENVAWVRSGELGGKRQTLMAEYEKQIAEGGLEQGALDDIVAKLNRQEELTLIDPEYIMHGFTDKGKKTFIKNNSGIFTRTTFGSTKQFSTEHASKIARTLEDDALKYPTVAEYNAAGRRGQLEGFGPEPLDFDVFETNPVRLTIEREMRGIPKIENARFLKDVRTKYGLTKGMVERKGNLINSSDKYGWIQVRNPETGATEVLYKSKTGPVKARYFEKEVRDHIDSVHNISTDPKEINIFGKLFDDVQGYWKSKTLAMFPAYHTRNIVGNLWNNYLAGVKHHSWYGMAGRIQYGQSGRVGKYSFDEVRELAQKFGVENQGQYAADIERKLQGIDLDEMGWRELVEEGRSRGWRGLGMANIFSLSGDDVVNIAGRRAGRMFENNARYAHFIKKLSDGMSPEEASQSVMKYLFDYGDISKVAQQTLGRVFPFFRWTRFNLPLQVETLMTQPGKIASLVHAKNVVEADPENQEVEDDLLATFIQDSFNIQTRRDQADGDKAEFFVLNNWIPAADLTSLLPERMGDELLRMLTPLIKTPVEQAFNYDTFRQIDIERDPGELDKFLGLTLRKKTIHAVRNVRFFTELDRLFPDLLAKAEEGRIVDPEEASLTEKLFRTFTGIRLYGVDVNLSRRIQGNLRRQGERGLRALEIGARRRGNRPEAERLREKIRESRQ